MGRLAPMLLAVSGCGRLGFEPAPDAVVAPIDTSDAAAACGGPRTTEFDTLPDFLELRVVPSITIDVVAGHLRVAMPPTPEHEGYAVTPIESFVGRAAVLQVSRVLAEGQTSMGVHASSSSGHLGVTDGTLSANLQLDGGSYTTLATRAYDPVTDAWWRMREGGGVLYYETSADGVAFTPLATTASFDVTSTYVDFGCYTADGLSVADEAHVERMLDCP